MPIQWGLDNDGKVVKDGNGFIFQIQRNLHEKIFLFFMAGCYMFMEKIRR